MLFQLKRPTLWIALAVVVLALGVEVLSITVDPNGGGPIWAVFLTVLIALLALNMFLRSRALARQLSQNARPGAVYELTLTDSTISLVTPMGSSTVRYEHYQAVNTVGDFVLLRIRGSRMRSIMPRGLYSEDALSFLQSRITA